MTTKREMPCYADLYDFFADMTMVCARELGTRATDYDEPGVAAEEIREAISRIAPGGLFMEKYGDRFGLLADND